MTKNHLKRMAVPKTWQTKRKGITFIAKPRPSGHALSLMLPLSVVIRDMLHLAERSKEVSRIIKREEVLINGRRAKEKKAGLGFMDVLSIPKTGTEARMSLNKKGILCLTTVHEKEKNTLPAKIIKKTMLKKGKMQITCLGGITFLADKKDYSVGDTLLLKFPEYAIQKHLSLTAGAQIMLIKGKHAGDTGTVEAISGQNLIYKNKEGKSIKTLKEYAFVVNT